MFLKQPADGAIRFAAISRIEGAWLIQHPAQPFGAPPETLPLTVELPLVLETHPAEGSIYFESHAFWMKPEVWNGGRLCF